MVEQELITIQVLEVLQTSVKMVVAFLTIASRPEKEVEAAAHM